MQVSGFDDTPPDAGGGAEHEEQEAVDVGYDAFPDDGESDEVVDGGTLC